jgi:hypothetical protein
MPALTCPLCHARKGKRSCPALGQTICATCCGTKRLVEIACPATCAYLSSARTHPAAVIQRRQDRDLQFMVPLLANLTEDQHRLVIYFLAVIGRRADASVPSLIDRDVADAAAAVAATLETAGKGIIYQHQASSIPAQHLAEEINRSLEEIAARAGSRRSRLERDAAVALRQVAAGATTAAEGLPGDEPPVFLRLVTRILSAAGASQREDPAGEAPGAGSRLIIPG